MNVSTDSGVSERHFADLVAAYGKLRENAEGLLDQLSPGSTEVDVQNLRIEYESLDTERAQLDSEMAACVASSAGLDRKALYLARDQAAASLQPIHDYLFASNETLASRDPGLPRPGAGGHDNFYGAPGVPNTQHGGAGVTGGAPAGPGAGPGTDPNDFTTSDLVGTEASRYTSTVNPQTLNSDMESLRKKLQQIQKVIHPRSSSPGRTGRLRSSAVRPSGGDAAVTSRLEEAHVLAQNMKRDRDRLSEELRTVQEERDDLREKLASSQSLSRSLETQLNDCRQQRDEMDTQIGELQGTIKGMESEIAQISEQLEKARAEADRERNSHKRDNEDHTNEVSVLSATNEDLRHKLNLAQKEKAALQSEVARLREFDPVECRAQLKSFSHAVDDLTRSVQLLTQENTELKNKYAAERADLLRTIDIFQLNRADGVLEDDVVTEQEASEIVRLTQELAAKNKEIDSLHEQLRASREQYRSAQRASKSMIGPVVLSTLKGINEMARTGHHKGHGRGHSFSSLTSEGSESYTPDYSSESEESAPSFPPLSGLQTSPGGTMDVSASIATTRKFLSKNSGVAPRRRRSSQYGPSGAAGVDLAPAEAGSTVGREPGEDGTLQSYVSNARASLSRK